MICKYCHEEINVEKENFPCECKDPVHLECLDRWNAKRKYPYYYKCEICKADYKTDDICVNCKRGLFRIPENIKFLIIIFFATLALIIFYVFLVDIRLNISSFKNITNTNDDGFDFTIND